MIKSILFIFNSTLLGVGLAMDAFSVSLANGMNEPLMKKNKMLKIAGVFAFFQALMPMLGWMCVHTLVSCLTSFSKFVPWIALCLLAFIGGKMIWDGTHSKQDEKESPSLSNAALLMQGVATSIDALSVGCTIADYGPISALLCSGIIAAVTLIICLGGLVIGKKFGTRLSDRASVLGGTILIVIGLEIFITGV